MLTSSEGRYSVNRANYSVYIACVFQYAVWCLLWFGINLTIISLYLEIGMLTHVSGFPWFLHAFGLKYTLACNTQ